VAAPLTEAAIAKMREMIASGELAPGARLLPEADLATLLGASRNTVREAVRALVTGAASGNETLASMLNAVSSRTIRARAWRGVAEEGAGARTVTQHQDILDALTARDPWRAEAAALVHVATTEAWFRQATGDWQPSATGYRDAARDRHGPRGRARA
jgi:GntR family transcriptional regulator, transcriptional repressor for pyruvate dehydrogenase complex